MKTFLAIVGGLALLIVGSFAVLFFIGVQKAGPLLQEAHDYADDAIPAIATKWDSAALSSRAAPELADLLKNGVLETLMAEGSRLLGEMTAYEAAACQITNYQLNTDSGELVLAACTARATHQRAAADYKLNLVKRNDQWKLLGFFVTPEDVESGPVQVKFISPAPKPLQTLEISLKGRSIGLSTPLAGAAPGAAIHVAEKIENIR